MTDARNTPIIPGCKAAFNLSGQIAVGTIIEIVPGVPHPTWQGSWVKKPRIRILRETHTIDDSTFSTVTDPRNVLVIFE